MTAPISGCPASFGEDDNGQSDHTTRHRTITLTDKGWRACGLIPPRQSQFSRLF